MRQLKRQKKAGLASAGGAVEDPFELFINSTTIRSIASRRVWVRGCKGFQSSLSYLTVPFLCLKLVRSDGPRVMRPMKTPTFVLAVHAREITCFVRIVPSHSQSPTPHFFPLSKKYASKLALRCFNERLGSVGGVANMSPEISRLPPPPPRT